MNYFIYTYIISLLTGRYELNKLTLLPMCGFIAQLVEHRTGIAEVTGSNPVEALIFFRLLLSSCLNWKIHCEDHSSLSSMTAVQIYELFHIYLHHFTPHGKIWTQQIGLITVSDAILTGRQSGQKLQCLYGNPMAKNFFQNRILRNLWIAMLKYQVEDCIHQVWRL